MKKLFPDDVQQLARTISIIENEAAGYQDILVSLNIDSDVPVIGVTGPPGAGKSTLINALISEYLLANKKIGVISIDPTSPFNHGSLLGDRIRMAEHYNNPNVFIRSLATRGALGGLSAKTIEITDVLRSSGFDIILIETVGVGQSEIEIAGLADVTLLVLVPEAGDEIQGLKSGVMEIADIFVINKADRPGADYFAKGIAHIVHERENRKWNPPVLKTAATTHEGIAQLVEAITNFLSHQFANEKRAFLLTEKAWQLIIQHRMKGTDKAKLAEALKAFAADKSFNLYGFLSKYLVGKSELQ
ncbi:MAG: methylmalonyl Co-A mutase-associated GTPase MeaB [Bacteroidetes bacterium]|nr:methylmalonyl Co-A mutase-associated GTPase MeaB [Bacteroidota bacterium]